MLCQRMNPEHQDSLDIGCRQIDEIVFVNVSLWDQKSEIKCAIVESFRDVCGVAAVKKVYCRKIKKGGEICREQEKSAWIFTFPFSDLP